MPSPPPRQASAGLDRHAPRRRPARDDKEDGGKTGQVLAKRKLSRSPDAKPARSAADRRPDPPPNLTKLVEDEKQLPMSARPLYKSDLAVFEPLFVYYLGLQKRKRAEEMDEREYRGRWKRFVSKWNRGELAEGWYDPEIFARVTAGDEGEHDEDEDPWGGRSGRGHGSPLAAKAKRRVDGDGEGNSEGNSEEEDEEEEERDKDDYLPALPPSGSRPTLGAKIPSRQDLDLRDELARESRELDREALRAARRADRALQKEQLEELAPRAQAGTRERALEKRRETNEKMRQFRDKSPGMEPAVEKELMGGGDSLEEYKKARVRAQRRKTGRQLRREEIERAKREEIETKRRAWRERENGTMQMLRELAKERFG